jgi:tagaturonate reductase
LLVIIPTELIPENGKVLKDIVSKLSDHNKLGRDFKEWLERTTRFCNSLVDRIVTRPSDAVRASFTDCNSLTIQAEPYKLWAIEGDEAVRKVLTFSAVDAGVIIAENIERYRERKLRLLNGTHTVTACLGFLSGMDTVYQCMQNKEMTEFIETVMLAEIEPTIPLTPKEELHQFAQDVLERYRNSYTAQYLLNITLQGTAKMKMRNIPTFLRYVEQFKTVPNSLAKGFAAHLLFMKSVKMEVGDYLGLRRGDHYLIRDDQAGYFYTAWKNTEPDKEVSLHNLVVKVGQNKELWDHDLTQLPKFVETVTGHLVELVHKTRS